MPGVCCGCVAKPASVQPRKTYNNLVAQLFTAEPIKTTDPLDTSLRRKIQKLQEYVQKNPAKIPKVGAAANGGRGHGPHAAGQSAAQAGWGCERSGDLGVQRCAASILQACKPGLKPSRAAYRHTAARMAPSGLRPPAVA